MVSKTRVIEQTLNELLKEYQELKERVNNLEKHMSVCEEFKHKSHVGMFASVNDLKKLNRAVKDLQFGGSQ